MNNSELVASDSVWIVIDHNNDYDLLLVQIMQKYYSACVFCRQNGQ